MPLPSLAVFGLSNYGAAVFWFGSLGAAAFVLAAQLRSAARIRLALFIGGWVAWIGWIALAPRNVEDRAGWLIALSGALVVWNIGFLVAFIRRGPS
jgi:hypothetical protein